MNKLPTKHLQHLHTKLMYLRDTSCIQLSRNIRFKTWTQTSKYFFKGNFRERINLVVRVTCELLKAPVQNYLTPESKRTRGLEYSSTVAQSTHWRNEEIALHLHSSFLHSTIHLLVEIALGPTSDISNLMVFPAKCCSPPEHLHAYKHVYIESARLCDCPLPGDLARSGARSRDQPAG